MAEAELTSAPFWIDEPGEIKRILYVEDDPVPRRVVESTLYHAGYSVQTVSMGSAWSKAVIRERPDMCLIDLALPDCSGLELLQRLRKTYPEVPALVITSSDDVRDILEALRLGAMGYFVKPIDPRHLVDSVRNAFELLESPCPAI